MTGSDEFDRALLAESRVAALHAHRIVDTARDAVIDAHLHAVTASCRTPMGIVAFLTTDSLWIKSAVGFAHSDLDLDHSVCKYLLLGSRFIVISDLTADSRTASNPLVTEELGARFYAAVPLLSSDNEILGSLSVMDTVRRDLDAVAPFVECMTSAAAAIMAHIRSCCIG